MKKIIILLLSVVVLTACSYKNQYNYNGEGEYWKAEYSFSDTNSNDEFILTYKGDLEERILYNENS